MTAIPAINRYYPSVPLSDLSDLYSVGANKLVYLVGTAEVEKRICIVSHLPKVLRIGPRLPITNKYVVFVEDTEDVDSIEWSVTLYAKGERRDNPAELQQLDRTATEFRLVIDLAFYSDPRLFDFDTKRRLFDRMKITCKVVKGASTVTLEIEHALVDMLNIVDVLAANQLAAEHDASRRLYISNPDTTNYLLNCLNDYVTEENLTWNRMPILANPAERENLLRTVIAIIYYSILHTFSTEFDFVVDLDAFDDKALARTVNGVTSPPYAGSLRNGICRPPLYALNDAIEHIEQVPDLANISSTNLLYAIIAGVGVGNAVLADGVSDFDGGVPEFMPPTIQAAKDRLLAAGKRSRLIELYNLTAFPKSCIKLTVILLKFLLECSKKNHCDECLNKQTVWPAMGFHQLQDQPDFWKNLLVHYLEGPSSQIKSFARRAENTFKLVGYQHTELILHHAPRIVTAYFANKRVRTTAVGMVCAFERIDDQAVRVGDDERALPEQPAYDSPLGRQVYLVVETVNCRGKALICHLQASSLSGDAGDLSIVVGPESWAGDPVFATRSELSVVVGQHDALNDIAGQREGYINVFASHLTGHYNVDHLDKAILKLNLRPDSQARFDAWAARLAAATGNVEITVALAVAQPTYFGNDPALREDPGQFLNANDRFDADARFRVVNRVVYEIFHADNQYSFAELIAANAARKKIVRLDNQHADDHVVYHYHDRHDNDHRIAEVVRFAIDEKGPRVDPPNIPAVAAQGALLPATAGAPNPLSMAAFKNAGEHIDADTLTFRANGTLAEGDFAGQPRSWYPNTGNVTSLIDADVLAEPGMGPQNFRAIEYLNSPARAGYTFHITFFFQDTRRRFANPDVFAALLGVFAQINLTPNPDPNPDSLDFNAIELISEGLSYRDGSCYPSTQHRNGRAFDVNYLRTSAGGLRVAENQVVIDAMRDHGFTTRLKGNNAEFGPLVHHTGANNLHDSHLHFGELDLQSFQIGYW